MCTCVSKRVPAVKYILRALLLIIHVILRKNLSKEKICSKSKVRHLNRRSGNLATHYVTINALDSEVYAKHLSSCILLGPKIRKRVDFHREKIFLDTPRYS